MLCAPPVCTIVKTLGEAPGRSRLRRGLHPSQPQSCWVPIAQGRPCLACRCPCLASPETLLAVNETCHTRVTPSREDPVCPHPVTAWPAPGQPVADRRSWTTANLIYSLPYPARIIHRPQKLTTESAFDGRRTPAQAHHRIIRLLKQAQQVVLALHQSVDLLPADTRHPHSPLGLTTST
jgi:hypothetical protein